MIFRTHLSNGAVLEFQRDTLGNVLISLFDKESEHEPHGTAIERGTDFKVMAGILGD